MRVRRPLVEETTHHNIKKRYVVGESIVYCSKCGTEKDVIPYGIS